MDLSIIIIGDEILIGQVTDTNSGYIARRLGPHGWDLKRVLTVGDNAADIRAAIETCMADSRLVITTGGLGPTKDDITKAVMTDIFGGELKSDPEVSANIRRVFERRGLKLNALTEAQALVPTSCRVIQNVYGTAPVMWFERDDRVLIAMPGVPFETEGMIDGAVGDAISERFTPGMSISHHTMMVSGITESGLARELDSYEASLPEGLHLAYLPTPGLIRLRLDGHSAKGDISETVERYAAALKERLGKLLVYDGDATAAMMAIEALRRHGLTVATAESCTGGNIAAAIISVAGCSDTYLGSVVSYANEVKINVLGVPASDIEAHGAVSREVVLAMARGAARVTGADCAVATSGVAGPGGGTPDKPVGTVWTAVHTPEGTEAFVSHYPGNRQRVINRAVTEALLALTRKLK